MVRLIPAFEMNRNWIEKVEVSSKVTIACVRVSLNEKHRSGGRSGVDLLVLVQGVPETRVDFTQRCLRCFQLLQPLLQRLLLF